jgi:predicted kinase
MDAFRTRLLVDSDQRVEHRDVAYRAMHYAAELLAPRCRAVVLDATYTARICRNELLDVVARVDGVLAVIECHVSAAVAEERFGARGTHPARDLTRKRVRALATSYPYYRRPPAIVTSTGDVPAASLLREALDKLLNNTDGVAWCASGLPRESIDMTADLGAEAPLAPAGLIVPNSQQRT